MLVLRTLHQSQYTCTHALDVPLIETLPCLRLIDELSDYVNPADRDLRAESKNA